MATPLRYDVVIVGGGTAGCVLAGRLSEDQARSVCLVEAGPDYGPYRDGRWSADILDGRWLPLDSHCSEQEDEADRSQRRARILGGCSAHNACVLVQGRAEDYDEWTAFAGMRRSPTSTRAWPPGRCGGPRRTDGRARVAACTGATDPLTRYASRESRPGPDVDAEARVRETAGGFLHPTGTCAMGAVVDRECRVLGYENILVADASVMPTIPRAPVNLTTAAVAERVAELIG